MRRTYFQPTLACALVLFSGIASAAQREPEPVVELTDAGKALETKYVAMQTALKEEIEAALPKRDDAKTAAWLQAIEAEKGPAKEAAAKAAAVEKMQAAEGKLRKLEELQKYAPTTISEANARLQRAKAMPDSDPEKAKVLKSAEGYLRSRQKEYDALPGKFEKGLACDGLVELIVNCMVDVKPGFIEWEWH